MFAGSDTLDSTVFAGGWGTFQRPLHVGGHQPEVCRAGALPPVVRHSQGAQH